MSLRSKSIFFAAIRANDILGLESMLSTKRSIRQLSADGLGFHMLCKSIELNRSEITQLLLDRGCRAHEPSFTGDSPLHLAVVKRNCYSLVKRLLDRGARVDQRNRHNETALHMAFEASASVKVIRLLLKAHLKKSLTNEVDVLGLSYLHIACAMADVDIVSQFVEEGGADVNAQVKGLMNLPYAGYTPLHMAVESGEFDVIEYLLQRGADVCIPNRDGSTAIHLALDEEEPVLIQLLFSYDDLRVNCVNRFGVSHLMAACACTSPTIAQHFLANKFNDGNYFNANEVIKAGDDMMEYKWNGYTPLHFAALHGRHDTVKFLLNDGANCCALTHYMKNPAELAASNSHQDVANLIDVHCQGFDGFSNCL